MLVHEINHRVKNNLSSIIGLLYSEQRYARTEDTASYQTLLQDLIGRIQGMAQVHAMLSDIEWLPLPLDQLTRRMVTTALQILPQHISVAVDITPTSISVPPKQATNMALVINELTTNTIKYALAGRSSAKITVRITLEDDDTVCFEFHNDGADYPEEVLTGDRRSLGLYLIETLVKRGLGGTLTLRNDYGPVTVIRFKRK
jgi:two-component sensor histidine kinase